LRQQYGALDGAPLLAAAHEAFAGRLAVVSSFGTESAVLLALVAEVEPALPVLFVDTGKLFGETLRYRDQLVRQLGLTGLRVVKAEPATVAAADADGALWLHDPDRCCGVRKVEPLYRVLDGFEAWVTGRKRFQGGLRSALPVIEADGRRIKFNPLASWSRERIADEFKWRGLPAHPLAADGFVSVGCLPCTDRVEPDADPRSGRWAGLAKTECGIHLGQRLVQATGLSLAAAPPAAADRDDES